MTTKSLHQLIASDRIEGTSVRRRGGDKFGSIERLMIDKISGKVACAAMRFGGFLSMGEQHYPIPWSLLKFNSAIDAYELDISEDVLSRANVSYGRRRVLGRAPFRSLRAPLHRLPPVQFELRS